MEYLDGRVLTDDGFIDGYVAIEDGVVIAVTEGACPGTPAARGFIAPRPVNAHTHCADGGADVPPGIGIEELVAPPHGLKHRYLRETPADELRRSVAGFAARSEAFGTGRFIDFREGGVEGCRLLRETVPDAVILGRPEAAVHDADEIDAILDIADGIGLPSISDIGHDRAAAVADRVHARGGLLALHVSERVREDIDAVLALEPDFVVHMTRAERGDIARCVDAGIGIVVCTRSNLFFGNTPPIGMMMRGGAVLSLGTDNAMICEPDLRAEARAFAAVAAAQGVSAESVWAPLLINGRKIIYNHKSLELREGGAADLTVLPCRGELTAENMLRDARPVTTYRAMTAE